MANRVNEAVLTSQGSRREAKMRNLLRVRAWAEQKAREAKKELPEKLQVGLNNIDEEETNGAHDVDMHDNDVNDETDSI